MANQKQKNGQMGSMIQRCHKWRQNRKKYLDMARITTDEIERERLFQMAEHYGRMVSNEQERIDNVRDEKTKKELETELAQDLTETEESESDDIPNLQSGVLPDFLTD